MRFTKMHGNGNDYIYVDCFAQEINPEDAPEIARRVSHRNKGIGSDGLVLIRPSQVASCKMDMYNSDGSMGRMCGNAIRCIAKFLYDKGIKKDKIITIETGDGIKTLELNINKDGICESVKANLYKPDFRPSGVPMNHNGEDFISQSIAAGDKVFICTCLSMGTPHLVTYVDDVDNFNVTYYGPLLENHELFPDRINVNFVQVLSPGHIKTRTWERGSGETMACGTGATASAVVSVMEKKTDRSIKVSQRGGDLLIEWDELTGDAFMTGPAEFICDGEIF